MWGNNTINKLMPTQSKNTSGIPLPINQKPKWKFAPYLLYFVITVIGTLYLWANRGSKDNPFFNLTYYVIALYWGLFLVAIVGYFAIRKYIVKKIGFKYSLFVFIVNLLWIFLTYFYFFDI